MQIGRGQALPWHGNIVIFDEKSKSVKLLDLLTYELSEGFVEMHRLHKLSGYAIINDSLYCIGGNYNGHAPHDQVNWTMLSSDTLPTKWYTTTRLPCSLAQHSVHVMSKFLSSSREP